MVAGGASLQLESDRPTEKENRSSLFASTRGHRVKRKRLWKGTGAKEQWGWSHSSRTSGDSIHGAERNRNQEKKRKKRECRRTRDGIENKRVMGKERPGPTRLARGRRAASI